MANKMEKGLAKALTDQFRGQCVGGAVGEMEWEIERDEKYPKRGSERGGEMERERETETHTFTRTCVCECSDREEGRQVVLIMLLTQSHPSGGKKEETQQSRLIGLNMIAPILSAFDALRQPFFFSLFIWSVFACDCISGGGGWFVWGGVGESLVKVA